jgi:hypothetical protein
LLDERFPTFYAVEAWLEAKKAASLAVTLRGWLPPQLRWRKYPVGSNVRKIDWEGIRIPDTLRLAELCELLEVNPRYVVSGMGSPYVSQARETASLASDIAAAVMRESAVRVTDLAIGDVEGVPPVNSQAVIAFAAESVKSEFKIWSDWKSQIRRVHGSEVSRIRHAIVSNHIAVAEGSRPMIVWGEFASYLVRMLEFFIPISSPVRVLEYDEWALHCAMHFHHDVSVGRPDTIFFQPSSMGIIHPFEQRRVDICLNRDPSEEDIMLYLMCMFGVLREDLQHRIPPYIKRSLWMPSDEDIKKFPDTPVFRRLATLIPILAQPRDPLL